MNSAVDSTPPPPPPPAKHKETQDPGYLYDKFR